MYNDEPNYDHAPDECLTFVCDECGHDLDNDSSVCFEPQCTGSAKIIVDHNSWLVSNEVY
jgi:hypothetical protein